MKTCEVMELTKSGKVVYSLIDKHKLHKS